MGFKDGENKIISYRDFLADHGLMLIAFILISIYSFSFASSVPFPLDQGYRMMVSENDSLRSIYPISEKFPFAGCSSIPEDYEGKCGAFVYDFCIESSDYISSNIQMSSEEISGSLKDSYDLMISSDRHLQNLKNRWFNIFLSSFNCTINRINSVLLFPTYIESCNDIFKDQIIDMLFGDLWVDVLISVDNYFSSQESTYSNGARSMNLLFSAVQEQADSLYYEGAGYQNYSSSASSFYDERIRSLISDYKSGRLDPQRESYSYLYVQKKSSELGNDSRIFSNCEMGIMHSKEYFSAFSSMLDLYRQTLSERAKLKSNYHSLLSISKMKYEEADSKLDYMRDNGYDLVSSSLIAYVSNDSQTTILESDVSQIPSNAIAELESILHGSGSKVGAEMLISQAETGVRDKTEFYYAKGMEFLSSSIFISEYSLNLSERIELKVSEVLSLLESKVVQKLNETHAKIESYSVWDTSTASVLDSVTQKYNRALEIYDNYNPFETTKGARISDLYSACVLLDEINETIAAKAWDVKSEKLKALNTSLQELNLVIQKAKLDGIDVTSEEKLMDSKKSILSLEISNITFIDESISAVNDAESAIYSRAEFQYSKLKNVRLRLYRLLDSLSKYVDVSDYVSEMNSRLGVQETYFSGGDFVPSKTLGSYFKIKSAYESILSDLERKSSEIIGDYLSNRYYFTNSFDSVPAVDSYVNVTSYLEVKNDLALTSSKPVIISVKNIPFAVNSIVHSTPSGVYATKNGTGILLYISNISENTTYYITIKTNIKPAVLSSKSVKRISLSDTRLVEKITYYIDSNFDTDSLLLSDGYNADSCAVYMNGKSQIVRSLSNLSILISGAKVGRSVVEATCVRNEPISFLSSNFTEEDGYIRYILHLKSNYEDYEDVDYTLQLLGYVNEIDPLSIRVTEISGEVPDNYSSYKYGDRYYAKWIIPLLSSEYINYTVQYRANDLASYYSNLKADIQNSSYYESVDVSNFIRDAQYKASTGNYNTAIDSLEKARKTITLAVNKKIENNSLTERLDKISAQISQLKNKSAEIYSISSNLSLAGVSVEISKQIAEYDSKVKDARNRLNSGDISSAKEIIKDLESMVSSNKIDNVLYSKEKKLTDELFDMQNIIFSLSRFTDVSAILEEIEQIKQELSVVAPATASNDYYSALTGLNGASISLDEIRDQVENSSRSAAVYFSLNLNSAKGAIDSWKKQKSGLFSTFSVSKNNPIQSIPNSVNQLVARMNETDSAVEELSAIYFKLKEYNTEEMLENFEEFEEMSEITNNITFNIDYLSNFTSRYRESSNELIKDISVLFDEKMKSGTAEEKQKITELQPMFSSAKTAYNNGMYLDSMLLSNYIQSEMLSTGENRLNLFDPTFIYIGILLCVLAVVTYAFTKKDSPKEPRKIEKIKLD